MKTLLAAFVTLLTLAFGITLHAQTVVWTNTASGGWNTAANWSPNVVPTSNNAVIINEPGVTVSLGGATSAGSITLGTNTGGTVTLSLVNQTLTLYGPLTVKTTGSFTVDSGALVGSSTNTVTMTGIIGWTGGSLGGVLTLAGGSTLNLTGTTLDMQNLTFTNNGTVIWTNGTIQGGGSPAGSIIYNYGLWNSESDQTWNDAYGGNGTTFNNYGTFRKSGGVTNFTTGTIFASGVVFNQVAGVLDVQNGTNGLEVAFEGGGNFTGGYITTNQNGLTVLADGSFTLNGTITGTNTWEDAGNLVGANVISGALTWVGGNWNSASSVTITANSTLIIDGGMNVGMDMEYCIVTNNGTVLWTSGIIQGGGSPNGTIIYNNSLWNAESDQSINAAYGGAGVFFTNSGTFRKSGGVTNITAGTIFEGNCVFSQVAGVLDVQNGTNGLEVAFEGGGNFTGGIITTNQNGLTVLSAGNFNINGTVTGTNTWEDSGNLVGTNVLNGALTWVGGNWNSASNVTIADNCTLMVVGGSGDNDMATIMVTNLGTVAWVSGALRGGGNPGTTVYNYGLWNAESDQTFNADYSGAGVVFNNYGTFRKSGGGPVFSNATYFAGSVLFNQLGGVIDVQSGTNGLELALQGGGNFTGGYITTNRNGLTVLSIGSFTLNGAVTGTNTWQDAGNLAGNNVINGALTWVGGNWNSATVTIAANTTVIVAGGSSINDMAYAMVTNYGTLAWSSGTIRGGGTPGTFIYNYGLWDAQSDQTMNDAYSGAGVVFNNYGTLRKSGGGPEFSNATYFSSSVLINQLAGIIDVQNGTNGLQLAFQGGGNFTGGYITTNQNGLTVLSSGSFTLNGTVTGTNTWQDSGNLVGNNVISGALTWVGGNWNSAAVTITNNTTVTVNGGSSINDMAYAMVTNYGTLAWLSGTIRGGGTPGTFIYNHGLWNAQSDQILNSAYNGAGVMFDNLGTFRKTGTSGGSTQIQSGVNFTNIGTLDSQIGNISLQGTYNFTNGTLNFGINSLTNFGTITLAGAVALTGTVSANLNNGYQPINGNTFSNLSFASFTGAFTNSVLPFLDAWTTNYAATNFYLHVLNARPTLNTTSNQTVDELTLLTVTNTATDPNLPPEALSFSLVSAPAGMTITTNTGVITWTPAQTNSPSTNTVTVSVENNGAPPLSATNSFTVTVVEVNKAPTLPTVAGQTVDVLALLTVTNTATNSNIHSTNTGYALISPTPTGVSITTNGIVTWTPTQAQGPNTNTITTVVTNFNPYDLVNPHLTSTNSFQVIVYAPTLAPIGNFTVNPGHTVTFTASAADNDHTRTLTFSLGTAPASATIGASSGLFDWRPPADSANTTNLVQVKVTANSTPSDTVTQSFDIIVNPLAAVTLTPVSKTTTQFEVEVSGTVGPDYYLQGTKSLSPTNWVNVQTNTPASSPFNMTTTNVTTSNEFYRVLLGP